MRVVSAPAPGATVDGSQTTAPNAASTLLRGTEVVLGITSVRHHIIKAIETLRKSGGQAIPCFANLAFEGETEPTPRPFFYVPDATCNPAAHGSTSGFIMSEERWEERLPRLVRTTLDFAARLSPRTLPALRRRATSASCFSVPSLRPRSVRLLVFVVLGFALLTHSPLPSLAQAFALTSRSTSTSARRKERPGY